MILLKYLHFGIMLCGSQCQTGFLIITVSLFAQFGKRLIKLNLISVLWLFLLEDVVQIIVPLFVIRLSGIDGVHNNFGVIHCAPANQTPVVVEGLELVLLNVPVHCLLDIELLLHLKLMLNK